MAPSSWVFASYQVQRGSQLMWELHYQGGPTDKGAAEAWLGKITMPLIEQVMAKLMLRVIEATEGLDLTKTLPEREEYQLRIKLVWNRSPTPFSPEALREESLPLLMERLRSAVPFSGAS